MAFLGRIRTKFGELLMREPSMRFGGDSGRDWLPPVLGSSDWSNGMMESMADRSPSWYYDQR